MQQSVFQPVISRGCRWSVELGARPSSPKLETSASLSRITIRAIVCGHETRPPPFLMTFSARMSRRWRGKHSSAWI